MSALKHLKHELLKKAGQKKKVTDLERFFQAYPGGYGQGDSFLGVKVPDQRSIAKQFYKEISLKDILLLLNENIHEHRLTAVFLLVNKYEKSKTEAEKKEVVDTYLAGIAGINNWDLVDSSAYKILGPWLMDKNRNILYEFAHSESLWLQRIAIIATLHFIRKHDFEDTLKLSEILLNHKHDLMHKAVGWMLREAGNRHFKTEYDFLCLHYKQMPRTMLRYAIEKFDEEMRQDFLKGRV